MATKLKDRVKVGLDETRMIVLVVQVLLGFECRAAFEPGFERLPAAAQAMKMISFGLLVVTLALLLGIPAFHRIAENGESTPRVETYLRRMMTYALWPFALALGLDLGIATLSVLSFNAGMAVAAAVTTITILAWYVIGRLRLFSDTAQPQKNMDEKPEPTPLEEKIKQVLTECRIVLPGTQAFLGFQLIATLTDAFSKLPRPEQFCHLGSLGFVALSGILLMTPPAYHRVAERGHMTERFLKLASVLVVCAMLPLALGICLDLYVVLRKVTHAPELSLSLAGAAFLTFVAFWYALPFFNRQSDPSSRRHPASAEPKAA